MPNPPRLPPPMVPKHAPGPATLRFVPLTEAGREPRRALAGDAGYDLFVSRAESVPAGHVRLLHTDIAVQLPDRMMALIIGRSSMLVNGIHVMTGLIDPGYRGELTVAIENRTTFEKGFNVGDRVGQLVLFPHLTAVVAQVEQLDASSREAAGFGSTGR